MLLRADEDNDDVIESFSLYYIFSVLSITVIIIFFTKITVAQNEAVQSYHRLCGLYFVAVFLRDLL